MATATSRPSPITGASWISWWPGATGSGPTPFWQSGRISNPCRNVAPSNRRFASGETDFTETVVPVTRTGGFLVKSVFYSAPSQLIGQRLRVHVYDDRIEAFPGATLVAHHPRAHSSKRRGAVGTMGTGFMSSTTTMSSMRCAANRFADGEPPVRQALCNSVYRDNLFPRSEYAEAWKMLQRDLPRRDACRRMVDLLFIAARSPTNGHVKRNWRICSRLTLACGTLPDPDALTLRLMPRHMTLPKDVAVAHPALDSFDALLGGAA